MEGKQWVEQVRTLLGKAKANQLNALKECIGAACVEIQHAKAAQFLKPYSKAHSLYRKQLIATLSVHSKHYALQDEIHMFTLALGHESLAGLDTTELEGLWAWLERIIDCIETDAG